VFAALADPTRRAILERLARREARVTEVAAPFRMSLNAVSKHIRVLERAGIVRRRIVGRDHYLAFNRAALLAADRWIEETRSFWNARLDQMERLVRQRTVPGGSDADAE
jgi:DNA-binding transcriptional ArsR family regulator